MRFFLLATLIGVAAAACGGDDSTGPTGSLSVEGSWSATISNLTGGGASCSTTSPVQLNLRQTGTSFTGTYSSGVLTCVTPTESFSTPVGTGSVTNGQVDGTTVTFDLGSPAFHNSGTLQGSSMSGTAEWTYDFGLPLEQVTLTGSWSATKQ